MNFSSIEFFVGRLLMVCSIVMLFPTILSWLFIEADVFSLLTASAITMIIGYSMTLHGKNETLMTNREAIMTVCTSWVMLSFCGALPYMFSGVLSPFYSILESVSGFTTVGTTLIADLSNIPRSILLWRSLTQWLGGMGVIVLFISFLPHYGSGATNLFNAELPGPSKERILPRISDTAFLLWKIYTGMTVIFAFIMYVCGLNIYDAITHSMTSISTGGFSSYNEGLRHFNNPIVEVLTAIFTILAAGSFYLYYQLYTRGWRRIFVDVEFRTFIILIFSFTTIVTYSLYVQGGYSLSYALHNGFFHVASALTSSGIAITELANWPPVCKFILFMLMFIGGCSSSTAGGLKISRLIILCKLSWTELKRILHPKMLANVMMGNKVVENATVVSVTRYFFIFIAIYFVSVFILTFSGTDFFHSLLIMASIIGTSGTDLAFALLPDQHSFITDINDLGKISITICMVLGRLEFFTLLVLLRPEFWRKTRNW